MNGRQAQRIPGMARTCEVQFYAGMHSSIHQSATFPQRSRFIPLITIHLSRPLPAYTLQYCSTENGYVPTFTSRRPFERTSMVTTLPHPSVLHQWRTSHSG
jgi:hypothetical protein